MTETKRIPVEVWKRILEESKELFAKYQDNENWGIDGIHSADLYELIFSAVTEQNFTFEKWANERKKKGLTTHVIELLGGAYFFDDLDDVDSLVGVRANNIDSNLLNEYKNDATYVRRLKKLIDSSKRKIFTENIFLTATWQKLKEHLNTQADGLADLIVIKPVAGLPKAKGKEDAAFYFQLIQRALNILSEKEGTILLKVPPFFHPHFNEFCAYLEEQPNIDLVIDERNQVLKIVKSGSRKS